MCVILDI